MAAEGSSTREGGRLRRVVRAFRAPPPPFPPEPPIELPEGRVVHVRGRGELFVRDSGGSGPPVLLLHGWLVSADLNWFPVYGPLVEAGYRVISLDHRGHGRGLRTQEPFTLAACAEDAAGVVRELGCGPVIAVGYSMGGPVAQLMARDHRDTVSAMVLCATAQEWQDPATRRIWKAMGALRLVLGLFPVGAWRAGLRLEGLPDTPATAWIAAELARGSSIDVAEAGRELGRYDSRPWIAALELPAAVVVTTRDDRVPPWKQYALAATLEAPVFEVAGDHVVVTSEPARFVPALLDAVRTVAGAAEASRAPASAGDAAA